MISKNTTYNTFSEKMKCVKSVNKKFDYSPIYPIFYLQSYYLVFKFPAISIKEKYKDKIVIRWDIPVIKKEIIKNIQIQESGILYADYTSDYVSIPNKSLSPKDIMFPNINEEFILHIPQYFELLENVLNFYKERTKLNRTQIPFYNSDIPIVNKIIKTDLKNVKFSYTFNLNLSKFVKIEINENFYFDTKNILYNKDIIDIKNNIILSQPDLVGVYKKQL
jgi:hypothetical protein